MSRDPVPRSHWSVVTHHPEGEHLRLVRSHAVPQRLVQDDLGAARVNPDQDTSMMMIQVLETLHLMVDWESWSKNMTV